MIGECGWVFHCFLIAIGFPLRRSKLLRLQARTLPAPRRRSHNTVVERETKWGNLEFCSLRLLLYHSSLISRPLFAKMHILSKCAILLLDLNCNHITLAKLIVYQCMWYIQMMHDTLNVEIFVVLVMCNKANFAENRVKMEQQVVFNLSYTLNKQTASQS